jgi:hypothetical protein
MVATTIQVTSPTITAVTVFMVEVFAGAWVSELSILV